ncbi:MAG: hypothetical protein EBU49_00300 [Proteobacteria bacterium]|nr:hypothetical protein [Pseudomonadota bacterium]
MLLSAEDCQELQYAKTIARERRWDAVTPARLFGLSVEARGIGKILQRISDNEVDDPSFGVRVRREWVMKARRFVRLGNHLRRRANALVVATNIYGAVVSSSVGVHRNISSGDWMDVGDMDRGDAGVTTDD